MRNALYARQSIDKKDSISIETQLEKALSECSAVDTIEKYVDRGYSGKNTNRPEFKRMMGDIQRGLIDRVIVYKLDRFSRSILDFSKAWEILSQHKVEFVSVNEKFDTSTPIGKAMIYITIVFAQMERETIAERITDNYYERVSFGNWPGGPAPYGFRNGRIQGADGKSVPTIIENEKMKIVDTIFEQYAQEGVSLGEIAKYITFELKEPGPKRVSWTNISLARMIRNPVYVQADVDVYAYFQNLGVKITNDLLDFTGEHAGILVGKRGASSRTRKSIQEATFSLANWPGRIPSQIWLKCQYKLAQNVQIKNTGKGRHTWLSGLIKCGYCGRNFKVIAESSHDRYKRLYCAGRADNMCSSSISWHLEDVEMVVEHELLKVLDQVENKETEEEIEVSNADKMQLKEIEIKLENLAANLANSKASEITMEYINRELETLQERRAELLQEIAKATKRKKVVYQKIEWGTLNLEEKKIVAKNYIDKVILYDKDQCQICWKV